MLATGFPSFRYGVRTVMGDAAGIPFVAAASGKVHGSNEFGHDRSKWDESGESSGIKFYWAVSKGANQKTASISSPFLRHDWRRGYVCGDACRRLLRSRIRRRVLRARC